MDDEESEEDAFVKVNTHASGHTFAQREHDDEGAQRRLLLTLDEADDDAEGVVTRRGGSLPSRLGSIQGRDVHEDAVVVVDVDHDHDMGVDHDTDDGGDNDDDEVHIRVLPDNVALQAATHVYHAVTGKPPWLAGSASAWRMAKVYHDLFWLRYALMAIWLILAFFEKPDYCGTDPTCPPSHVPTSGVPTLSRQATAGLELVLLAAMMALDPLLKLFFRDGREWLTSFWPLAKLCIGSVAFVDICVTFAIQRSWRVSPWMRVLLFVSVVTPVRRTVLYVVRSLLPVAQVLFLVVVLLASFSWFGMLLWMGTPEGDAVFPNPLTAAKNLLVCLTTANFPNVMQTAYDNNRSSIFFWAIFILVGLYFLMPLLLAVIYNSYRRQLTGEAKRLVKYRAINLNKAFFLLQTATGNAETVSKKAVHQVLQRLNGFAQLPHIATQTMRFFVAAMDVHGSGRIDRDHFHCITMIFQLKLKPSHRQPALHRAFPCLFQTRAWKGFARVIRHKRFDTFMDVVVLSNVVVMAIETALLFHNHPNQDEVLSNFELAFAVAYAIEVVLKLLVLGGYAYWDAGRNRFDFVVTVLSVGAEVLFLLPQVTVSVKIVRILLLVRLMRMLRLLLAVPRYRVMFAALSRLFPLFSRVIGLLLVLYYTFALIGMHCFGGKIYDGVPALAGTPFAQYGFWANNWNDFPSAMVVLFELQVVNNWQVIMNAAQAVTHPIATLYFVSFWLLTVVIVFNLLVAFVLEAFMVEWGKVEASGDSGEEGVHEIDVDDLGSETTSELQRVRANLGAEIALVKQSATLETVLWTSS